MKMMPGGHKLCCQRSFAVALREGDHNMRGGGGAVDTATRQHTIYIYMHLQPPSCFH